MGNIEGQAGSGARDELLTQIAMAEVVVGHNIHSRRTPESEPTFDITVNMGNLTMNPNILSTPEMSTREALVRAAAERLAAEVILLDQQARPEAVPEESHGQ